MLRFRLGSIPVEVHPSHLFVSALLAYGFMPGPGAKVSNPAAWPHRYLADPGGPEYAKTVALYVLSWMLIVSVSVLVHELGHALAGRAFGYRPSITLVWLGGHTQTNAPGPIPWLKDVVLTAAGPLFGLLLGVAALLGYHYGSGHSEVLDFILIWSARANFFWAVLNLLPILPLDGGRIVSTVATRLFGRRGFLAAQGLALLVATALVAFALAFQEPFLGILFGVFGLQALRVLTTALQEERPVSHAPQEPLVRALEQARVAFEEGKLEEARRQGLSVLENEALSPELLSHAHHLLGWVALKEGKGRAALDHFSQVQRRPVETQALAAAFSLVGDDLRALALWELAWQEARSRTVLHEYAGALIRAGRVQEALRLPGVEPELAFSCAERVLSIRGAYSEAAAVAEAGLAHAPGVRLAYDAACAFAQARQPNDAMRLLRCATELGFRDAAFAASDADLTSLHGNQAFEDWLVELQKSASA